MLSNIEEQVKAVKAKFKETQISVDNNIVTAVTNHCLRIEGTSKKMMRDTETNPDVAYGRRKHHPSKPGNAPAVDYGTLRRSITHDVKIEGTKVIGRVGSVITNPPYGSYLEHGTSKMQPRPWLKPSTDANSSKIPADLRAVVEDTITEVSNVAD